MASRIEQIIDEIEDYIDGCKTQAFAPSKILSLIHISEPTRRTPISYAVFCLKKKKKNINNIKKEKKM